MTRERFITAPNAEPRKQISPGAGSPARAGSSEVASTQTSSIVQQLPRSVVESLRYLLGRRLLSSDGRVPSPLAVVSALHGEGVTTISKALAAIIANDLNERVCWIDLSWTSRTARPSLQAADGVAPGIIDVIGGQHGLDDVIQPTEHELLCLLGPGYIGDDQREALARSGQLSRLIDEVAEEFRYVVLDLPPILAGSEALATIRHSAAHIMVVRHGVTTAQQLKMAADEVRNVPSFGVVLNQFKTRIPKRLARFFSP
jgi:Mrp family chromosome partitioning ATPase